MAKKTLELLGKNTLNYFAFPQATIDAYSVDQEDKELFRNTLDLFSKKAKSHLSYQYVKQHLNTGLVDIDIVRISKYPLPVAYNISTKKSVINISALGKRVIGSIEPRDIYTLVLYCHVASRISKLALSDSDLVAQYLSAIHLKIFSKSYGLTGSYSRLIPELRYLITVFVLVSFFGFAPELAFKRAVAVSRFDISSLKINLPDYDFSKISQLVKALGDAGTLPGINLYKYISLMIRNFGVTNIVLLEDLMRFCSCMMCATINGNTVVPPYIQSYNPKLFKNLIVAIQRGI